MKNKIKIKTFKQKNINNNLNIYNKILFFIFYNMSFDFSLPPPRL